MYPTVHSLPRTTLRTSSTGRMIPEQVYWYTHSATDSTTNSTIDFTTAVVMTLPKYRDRGCSVDYFLLVSSYCFLLCGHWSKKCSSRKQSSRTSRRQSSGNLKKKQVAFTTMWHQTRRISHQSLNLGNSRWISVTVAEPRYQSLNLGNSSWISVPEPEPQYQSLNPIPEPEPQYQSRVMLYWWGHYDGLSEVEVPGTTVYLAATSQFIRRVCLLIWCGRCGVSMPSEW